MAEMRLGEKQELFSHLLGKLLVHVSETPGYRARLREVYRAPEQAKLMAQQGKGIANSLHTIGLAADVILFHEGKYLTRSEEYEWAGEWWEAQHELCAWGGRFSRPDGVHFSIEHNGIR